MVPKETTIAIFERELEGARAWADRHGIKLVWDFTTLELHLTLKQPETSEVFYLRGQFDNYREEPPAWTFCGPDLEGDTRKSDYPCPVNTPFGGSIFHSNALICAPFNRLAYSQYQGPHGDWGGPAQWTTAGGNNVRATTIGDMLQIIYRDFRFTRGRMS